MNFILITPPKEFSFELSMQFLQRSPREVLHRVGEASVTKLISVSGVPILFRVSLEQKNIRVDFLNESPSDDIKTLVVKYVTEWFDLENDLEPFYKLAKGDKLLGELVKKYYGYRIIGQPDLFESIVWAVLGQQINVQFAYTLKQRFVEKFGTSLQHEGLHYYLFPTPQEVSQLTIDQLLPLQFSRQKAAYSINIAEAFASGKISKEGLLGLPLEKAKEELMKIKGVGNWTANYALMKTFRYPDAFPLEDVGIHNAIRILKKMKTKPTLDQVKRIFKKYKGWEAYATLYLWKSLSST